MDQTWCPVCPVAVKGELLRCNEATAEQGLSLTIQDWEELQAKLVALLARQVRNYTKGESDSVPLEMAQALLDSICFTLGLDLEDPGERGRELLARDLAKELTSRRERLRGEMVRGNILWVSLCRALPPVKNRAMQDTLWAKKGPPPLGQEPGAKGGGKERKRIWIKVKIGTGGGRF